MAGLEGIDATSMELVDALGAKRWTYEPGDRIAKPVVKHTDFLPVAHRDRGAGRPEGAGADGSTGDVVLSKVRFGLPVGPRILTNARADNLASPAWRGLWGKPEHHALAAVSYVVEKDAATGTSYRIQPKGGGLIVVPALTAVRHYRFASTGNEYDDRGHVQLTADANAEVAKVHGRFVVELPDRAAREAWLHPETEDPDRLMRLLRPAPAGRYELLPIAPDVWTRKDDPEAVRPREPAKKWF